ncbi:MAG: peptide deformylase [Gammaproteobacteria bacterium RIFCSPHIGHO2_12_FULL_42_10]|nr:MAG: peptide deformylase [Gammaproteobacteria bacterium RIFCSPHIGHO2_12_FULL_42_10]
MALLKILKFPNPRLRTVAEPVHAIDDALRRTMDDMYETMYAHHGVGLAATQVDIHRRFFTMDVSESRKEPLCVINPEIISKEGVQYDYHGCLSVGGNISDKIKRAAKLRLRGMDLTGKIFEWDLEELAAICVQHEMDHLNGLLFIDHLSRLKQGRIREKLEKANRE